MPTPKNGHHFTLEEMADMDYSVVNIDILVATTKGQRPDVVQETRNMLDGLNRAESGDVTFVAHNTGNVYPIDFNRLGEYLNNADEWNTIGSAT